MSEPRYSVIDGLSTPEDAANGIHSRQWLVVEVDGCTCGSPLGELPHEPGCGAEPIGRITDILAQVEAMQRRIAELEAEVAQWKPTGVLPVIRELDRERDDLREQAERDRGVIEAARAYCIARQSGRRRDEDKAYLILLGKVLNTVRPHDEARKWTAHDLHVERRQYSLDPWRLVAPDGHELHTWASYPNPEAHMPPYQSPVAFPTKRAAVAELERLKARGATETHP